MNSITKTTNAAWLALVVSCGAGCGQQDPAAYQRFCTGADNPPRWHLVVYMDTDACLTCNEDMDAWRELVVTLREDQICRVSVYAPREDSSDVYWAMKLEEIADTVVVLDQDLVEALGWSNLGTPVKVLLDSDCRPVKIAGRMGNKKDARCFIEEIQSRINLSGPVASAPRN